MFLLKLVVISIENESSQFLSIDYSVIAISSYPGSNKERVPSI